MLLVQVRISQKKKQKKQQQQQQQHKKKTKQNPNYNYMAFCVPISCVTLGWQGIVVLKCTDPILFPYGGFVIVKPPSTITH